MALELEFTVEPFDPGNPGPHVRAAEDAARATGAELKIGPFGTIVTGELEQVMSAVAAVVRAATAAGATRVTMQLSARDADGELAR
ncbi:MAG: thiamine-binding protein [Acidimicrobiales bacterium]